MSAAVTQWFPYARFDRKPGDVQPSRRGWYSVKRGTSKKEWMAYWNGNRFSKFKALSMFKSIEAWMNEIARHPDVSAFRGLAEKPQE